MRRKPPTTITVLGILNIIYGITGPPYSVGCSLCNAFGLGAMWLLGNTRRHNEFTRTMAELWLVFRDIPGFVPIEMCRVVFGLVMGTILICAGIGLLKLRPWARRASLVYGVATILAQLAYSCYAVLVVNPAMGQLQGRLGGGLAAPNPWPGMTDTVSVLIGNLFTIAYPVVLLIFMLSPRVAAALAPPVDDFHDRDRNSADDLGTPPPPLPPWEKPQKRDQGGEFRGSE